MNNFIISSSTTKSNVIGLMIGDMSSLDDQEYARFKARQHADVEKVIAERQYKPGISAFLHEIVNTSNKSGVSNVSQSTLSGRLHISESTIRRYIAKLKAHLVITYKEGGWGRPNTTTVLVIEHVSNHIPVKMETNLTSDLNLEDKINILPLKSEVTYNSNLESMKEYVELTGGSRENANVVFEKEADEVVQALEEITKELPKEVADTVRIQVRREAKKNTIRFPRAFVSAIAERETKKYEEGRLHVKHRNFGAEQEINRRADEMAKERLKVIGVTDPRLGGLADYGQIGDYDSRMASMYVQCIAELSTRAVNQIADVAEMGGSTHKVYKAPRAPFTRQARTWNDN